MSSCRFLSFHLCSCFLPFSLHPFHSTLHRFTSSVLSIDSVMCFNVLSISLTLYFSIPFDSLVQDLVSVASFQPRIRVTFILSVSCSPLVHLLFFSISPIHSSVQTSRSLSSPLNLDTHTQSKRDSDALSFTAFILCLKHNASETQMRSTKSN